MRIFLVQSGGFVQKPLKYEVDVTSLDKAILPTIEKILATKSSQPKPLLTSAGGITIQVVGDDKNSQELFVSFGGRPDQDVGDLLEALQKHAKIISS